MAMSERTTKKEMLEKHILRRGVRNPSVLQAMESVERKNFLPKELEEFAYEDGPLPIGKGQTISQPYIVAFMADALKLRKSDNILEVGSGCGYNAAVLSKLVNKVYTMEIIEWLAELAQHNLDREGCVNVHVRYGDGYRGWPEKAPFDSIILTAACPEIPIPLKRQLKIGGKILAPVGTIRQELTLLEKLDERKFRQKTLIPVRFVSMTGMAQKEARERLSQRQDTRDLS